MKLQAMKSHTTLTLLLSVAAVLLLTVFPLYYYPPLLQPVRYTSTSITLVSYSLPSSLPRSPPSQRPPPPPPPPPSGPPPPQSSHHPPPPQPIVVLPPPRLPQPSFLSSSSDQPQLPVRPILQLGPSPEITAAANNSQSGEEECDGDISKGEWVRDPNAPYYTNSTCWTIQEHQNCLKYGRPDTEFLKWRWKPDGCELPVFDPAAFLELVRGKSMAFVGDSLARNQMQSLMCLLSRVQYPKDISSTSDDNFKRMYYEAYDFTISIFWSPFLVRAEQDPGQKGQGAAGWWKLHLDQADGTWAAHLGEFDYLVISGGNWFTRPSHYYHRRRLVGCNYCEPSKKVKRMTLAYANKRAFQTALRAVTQAKGYRGVTLLRTLSPAHFEGGSWNDGGDCRKTGPYGRGEARMVGDEWTFYRDQLALFREAAAAGRRKGLAFELLDATQAMLMRPDGHPSRYGRWQQERQGNRTAYNDCVHWCLPGPVDMWNDVLLQVMRSVSRRQSS